MERDLIVVGVMPLGFDFPGNAELWVPARSAVPEHVLKPTADMTQDRGSGYLEVIARMKTGVSAEQAQADLKTVAERSNSSIRIQQGTRRRRSFLCANA